MTTPAIIFSKNRPMQLDALLRSLKANWPYCDDVTVLWRATSAAAKIGYEECLGANSWADYTQETDFHADLADLLPSTHFHEHVVFFVDDDLLYEPVDDLPTRALLSEPLFSFSLRLGLNTNYCYPLNCRQRLRYVLPLDGGISWEWLSAQADYGYPASVDGHIMRVGTLRAMLEGEEINNPYELERTIAKKAPFYGNEFPLLGSYSRSRLVGVPHNSVISGSQPRNRVGHGNAEQLLWRYLEGERIDWENMDFSTVNAAHTEVPYVYRMMKTA